MPDPLAPRDVTTPLWWPLVRAALLLLCVWLVAFPLVLLLRPAVSYRVANGQITASSMASRTVIPAGRPVKEEPLVVQRRLSGSDIPGYVIGIFDVAGHQGARLYTDGSSPALVFDTPGAVTILTPSNRDELLRAWRSGETAIFYPAQRPRPWLLLILGALTTALLGTLLGGRRRITYEWTPDALITRSAGHTHRFPYQTTAAEITAEPLGIRLFGTAIPGYLTGSFSTRSLGRVQAIATTARPDSALLLKQDGRTYYLTPNDNDPQMAAGKFRPR